MINAAEFATLGAQVAQTFTASAIVLRLTQVADSSGGFTDTYATAATYPCSFGRWDATPVERESQPRVLAISNWRFVFAVDVDIRTTDRLLVGTRTFEVVDAGVGSADTVRRVTCLEIT